MNKNKYLVSILEKEMLEVKNLLNQMQILPAKVDSIVNLLNENNIINIKNDDLDFINSELKFESKLTSIELEFLNTICSFDSETKEFISYVGFDDKQRAILLNIKRKIEAIKTTLNKFKFEELNKSLDECNQTISNLKNTEINLITNLDFIKEILNKHNVNLKDQIEIFLMLNKINLNIYNSFDKTISIEDDILDESNLKETNLSEIELKSIFEQFGQNFDSIYNETNKQFFKQKILKFGNVKNISEILSYLKDKKELHFLFSNVEVLTKILIYSSVEKIDNVIKIAEENGIKQIIKQYPVILFPKIREYISKKNLSGSSQTHTVSSGCMHNFLMNIELLKELNISVNDAYKKCSTFFAKNPKNTRKILSLLELYGIRTVEDTNNVTFSVLRSSTIVSRRIDIAIETGCYEYCKQNLSRLCDDSVNFYRIKYAKKINGPHFSPFKTYKKGVEKVALSSEFAYKNSVYGDRPNNTYELYNAVIPEIKDREKYDNIIEMSENFTISELSLNDEVIKQLDSLYMDQSNSLVYNFEGVIISRYKVLRNYETLISNSNVEVSRDMLLYTICINSMLDLEELNKINNCLDKVKFARRSLK